MGHFKYGICRSRNGIVGVLGVSSAREATVLLHQIAGERLADETVGGVILRVAKATRLKYSRARKIWYGLLDPKVEEMDVLRAFAVRKDTAIAAEITSAAHQLGEHLGISWERHSRDDIGDKSANGNPNAAMVHDEIQELRSDLKASIANIEEMVGEIKSYLARLAREEG